ncbi:fractalkine-like isoform X2 [Heliangelus exortis]|uniref:fractalkine-like isoform X2 n=1 Tax=Heliangelus exortis TaxID=472823 RepID=UPI003A93EE3D
MGLGRGQPKAPLKCSAECRHYSSRVAEKRIRSYRLTEPQCSQQAVVFTTLRSVEICADPEAEWVKKIVEKLDQKKAASSSLPHEVTSAVAPEDPGVFQKHVGHTAMAPAQASAPSGFFQGTARSPPVSQDTSQHHAESSPGTQAGAAHSAVTPEANRDSLKSPEPSPTLAAGWVSSQPTPHPTDPPHGFHSAAGYTEGHLGRGTSAVGAVPGITSSSDSGPVAIAEGSDHPQPNKPLEHGKAQAPAPLPGTSRSGLPSILGSMESTTVPATPLPPEIPSVSAQNSTAAADKGPSVPVSKVGSSSAFGTTTFDSSSAAGKEEPPGPSAFPGQGYPVQAGLQVSTGRSNILPPPSLLTTAQTHFVIPVAVVAGLTACSVAVVWLYLKFGVKAEETSREMVQGLLYQKERQQSNVYPMAVI